MICTRKNILPNETAEISCSSLQVLAVPSLGLRFFIAQLRDPISSLTWVSVQAGRSRGILHLYEHTLSRARLVTAGTFDNLYICGWAGFDAGGTRGAPHRRGGFMGETSICYASLLAKWSFQVWERRLFLSGRGRPGSDGVESETGGLRRSA